MRAYYFGNFYLSSIQQGIQADHCSGEMVVKYAPYLHPETDEWACPDYNKYEQMRDYLENHKTDVLLNGGDCDTLREIHAGFNHMDNPYPHAKFHESVGALNGALTCVGIILPEEVYEIAAEVRRSFGPQGRSNVDNFNDYGEWDAEYDGKLHTFDKWHVWLINEINKYPLAK